MIPYSDSHIAQSKIKSKSQTFLMFNADPSGGGGGGGGGGGERCRFQQYKVYKLSSLKILTG